MANIKKILIAAHLSVKGRQYGNPFGVRIGWCFYQSGPFDEVL
jgi:hypothetical protein